LVFLRLMQHCHLSLPCFTPISVLRLRMA